MHTSFEIGTESVKKKKNNNVLRTKLGCSQKLPQ